MKDCTSLTVNHCASTVPSSVQCTSEVVLSERTNIALLQLVHRGFTECVGRLRVDVYADGYACALFLSVVCCARSVARKLPHFLAYFMYREFAASCYLHSFDNALFGNINLADNFTPRLPSASSSVPRVHMCVVRL